MKLKILFVLTVMSLTCFAQNQVLEIPVDYKSIYYSDKASLAISNEKTGELVIYIEDDFQTKAYLLDKDLQVKSALRFKNLPNKFKDFIGYNAYENDMYEMIFTNSSKKKYGALHLDFANQKTEVVTLDFKFKKEAHVQGVTVKDKFYMISSNKGTNTINFYGYKAKAFTKLKSLSLDEVEYKSYNYTSRAYNLLVTKGIASSGSLVKMDNNTPNAIEITSKPNKLYTIDDALVITFDHLKSKTIAYKITVPDFQKEVIEFEKPEYGQEYVKHNSYIYDSKIFQIKANASEMKFTVKDFESKKLLKEIYLNKKDSITFKNTPIIQEGPGFILGTRTREMEATSKFLRKISNGDIGISTYKKDNIYKLILGGKVEVRRGGGGIGAFGAVGAIPVGAIGPISVGFNPTFFAYGGYSSTKSTRIECLFDDAFEHQQGEVPNNVFDDIKAFEDWLRSIKKQDVATTQDYDIYEKDSKYLNTRNIPKLTNVFRHNGKIYFSFIGSEDRIYHLVEFAE
jgi:hypothetical protein